MCKRVKCPHCGSENINMTMKERRLDGDTWYLCNSCSMSFQLKSHVDNIIEHINKARLVAEHEYIKANMIIIDQDIAETNHLIVPHFDYSGKLTSLSKCKPMIFGLNVEYKKNLTEDLGVNFIITEAPNNDRIKELEAENAELRDKLNKMKEILGL